MERNRSLKLCLTATILGLSIGCVDSDKIFDRPSAVDPGPGSGGFLGYSGSSVGQTVCGNCHAGTQARWSETAHADAWDGLQASGHAAEFCEACHTVSPNGNAAEAGGWPETGDTRYHDVQCESCHGPGDVHLTAPDVNRPLASLAVGEGTSGNCGDCHSDTHHPFVEEWQDSPHSGVIGFAAARPECASCHRGQETLAAWGVNANYLEREGEALAVVCGVCHDPHEVVNEKQLRFPVNTTSIELHLCSRCHNRRSEPDPEDSHGLEPHSPESALLIGEAGWFPPGIDIGVGQIRGTHGTARNSRFCAGCHVVPYTVTDAATGAFVWSATGHLFRPIPCVDEQGIPQGFEVDCELSTTARNFDGCAVEGCHGDPNAALSALLTAKGRVEPLVDELHDLLVQVDPNLDGPGGEIDPEDPTFTVAEGAFFNLALAEFGNPDFNTATVIGSTVHNPFLIEALLVGSIEAVEDEYGVSANLRVELTARLQEIVREYGVYR